MQAAVYHFNISIIDLTRKSLSFEISLTLYIPGSMSVVSAIQQMHNADITFHSTAGQAYSD